MTQPTFVLVHGAWMGPWCWRDLGLELTRRDVAWRTVQLPSSDANCDATADLYDDAARVVAATNDLDNVVLVGHSYGGMVITEAAPQIPGLVGAIYIAALVPTKSESATETARAVRVRSELDDAIEVDGALLRLNPEKARGALFGQCDEETSTWALRQLGRQTVASFRSPRKAESVDVSSLYIKCRSDRSIDPGLQNVMATRCDEHIEIESDHSPFLSHPHELADALIE